MTLDYFARTFLGIAFWGHPVVNKTGISGLYDIHRLCRFYRGYGMVSAISGHYVCGVSDLVDYAEEERTIGIMEEKQHEGAQPFSADDPYWMHMAMFHVRARHAEAGTQPATFGDLVREAEDYMLKEKARLGVKASSSRPS